MIETKNIYFLSDIHLGMHPLESSRERERVIVQFLEEIRPHASELWLMGDIFDYWYEYKHVVPRGFTRFLGTLASMADEGIEIHIFKGNHDVWYFDYMPEEIGARIHTGTEAHTWNGVNFLLGHGDGLLPSDRSYRLLQSVFHSRIAQWMYSRIHPNGSMAFAKAWSKKSRNSKHAYTPFLGADKEHQVIFARNYLHTHPDTRYFIFGHRHVAFDISIAEESQVFCLGDWIHNFTYAVFNGEKLELKQYYPDRGEIIRQ